MRPCTAVQRHGLVQEVIDLSEEDQAQLWREVAAACRAIRKTFNPTKLNIGAIGNFVRPSY